MKNDLDTQLQRQFQSSEQASYAKKCSTIYKGIYISCLRALYTTTCVAQTVAGYEDNKVLNTTAQEIDASEIDLPRKARTLLAQLRPGWIPTNIDGRTQQFLTPARIVIRHLIVSPTCLNARCTRSTWHPWIGTNFFLTFSMKLAFFREKRRFPWSPWFFCEF